jgi:NADPH-dependent curcumin reductase CurA
MQGFLVGDPKFGAKWAPYHQRHVTKMLKEGKLKTRFHEWHGIDQAAEAFVGMLKSENFGKAILNFKS